MKDPAFLFYYQDFLVGTDEMTNEEVGAYIRCLCHQAHKGHISEKHMKNICNSSEIHNAIKSKFISENNDGLFINSRLKLEIEKRKKYTESRSNNRKGKTKDNKDISKTYEKHMENENEDVIENINSNKEYLEIKNQLTDEIWKETFCINSGITSETFDLKMDEFLKSIQITGEYKEKNMLDLKSHFLNIIRKSKTESKKQQEFNPLNVNALWNQ